MSQLTHKVDNGEMVDRDIYRICSICGFTVEKKDIYLNYRDRMLNIPVG